MILGPEPHSSMLRRATQRVTGAELQLKVAVTWGGLETGYDDPDAKRTVTDYLRRWHAHNPVSSKKCRVQLTRNDSRFYDVAYVPHGRTRWGVPAAPYCPKAGRAPLW